jgi:hypothetical protein
MIKKWRGLTKMVAMSTNPSKSQEAAPCAGNHRKTFLF